MPESTKRATPGANRANTANTASGPSHTPDQLLRAKLALVAAREQQPRVHSDAPDPSSPLTLIFAAYPQYTAELTEFNTALVATTSYEREPITPEYDQLAARARSRAFAAAFPAPAPALQPAPAHSLQSAFASLKALRKARNISTPTLAKRLGLGVDVISDLEAGLIRPASVPERFLHALSDILSATADQLSLLLQTQAVTLPGMQRSGEGASKAPPTGGERDFADVIRHSPNMTPDQKTHWLTPS